MKKIAILGSRQWGDAQAVSLLVNTLFNAYGAYILVSGGSDGVCKVAEVTAQEFGFPVISFRPVKIGGDLTTEDSYGVEEWRLYRGKGEIIRHYEPSWADYSSAAHYRSWMIADRCDEAHIFWNGSSPGTSFEIDLLEGREKLVQVIK